MRGVREGDKKERKLCYTVAVTSGRYRNTCGMKVGKKKGCNLSRTPPLVRTLYFTADLGRGSTMTEYQVLFTV